MEDVGVEYESFSDWEPSERDAHLDTSQGKKSRPLSFVLVEDDEPSVATPGRASIPDGRPKRRSPKSAQEALKRRRTAPMTPNNPSSRARMSATISKSSPPVPSAATHNAELDTNVPVYDINDRIPRYNRPQSSQPASNPAANTTREATDDFANTAVPDTPISTGLRLPGTDSFQRLTSKRSKPPVSDGPIGLPRLRGSSIRQQGGNLDALEKNAFRSRSQTNPMSAVGEIPDASPSLKPIRLPEPSEDNPLGVPPHVSPGAMPDRAFAPPRQREQRRHSAPGPHRRKETLLGVQPGPNEHTHSAKTTTTTIPSNADVQMHTMAEEPTLPAPDTRIPFGMPPPLVGAPPFPRSPYAMPPVRPGGNLGFDLSRMTGSGVGAPNAIDHRVPKQHFALDAPQLGAVADERFHGLPPHAVLHMNRMPHPSYLPFPPMVPMTAYREHPPMPTFFPQVSHMPMNPYVQHAEGVVYPNQSAIFNPTIGAAPLPCNPISASTNVVPGLDPESAPVSTRVMASQPVHASDGHETNKQAWKDAQQTIENPRLSADSLDLENNRKVAKDDENSRRRKQSARKQQLKKPADPSVIEVDEIPCDDEEDGVDYVSRLIQIQQKKKFLSLPVPLFFPVQAKDGGGAGWKCVMTAKLLNKSPPEVIETTKVARNQKRAKRAAAKELLSSLESRVPELFQAESNGKPTGQAVKSQSALNAISVLVRDGHLPCMPNMETEEVNDTDEDRWRCTATLFTNDHGRKIFVEYGPSKSSAKQKWARKALETLIALKASGAEQYRCFVDPVRATKKKTMASVPKASELIVRTSDDERSSASCDDIVEDMDFSLELPSDYELVVAKTDADCERWFDVFAQPGAKLGVFIDSKSARLSVDENYSLENDCGSGKVKLPIICFSTASSCIVIRIDNKKELQNESGIYHVPGTFWVPESAAEAFEDPRVQKAVLEGDDGLDLLTMDHGIQCATVQDVAVSSLAIAGYGKVSGSGHLSSLRDLTKYWMRKEAKDVSWEGIWPGKRHLVEKWLSQDSQGAAIAVLCAYATFCIREKVGDAARLKRINSPGAPNDLDVLSRRIVEVGVG